MYIIASIKMIIFFIAHIIFDVGNCKCEPNMRVLIQNYVKHDSMLLFEVKPSLDTLATFWLGKAVHSCVYHAYTYIQMCVMFKSGSKYQK